MASILPDVTPMTALRLNLAEGLERGEALLKLTGRVQAIFDDPLRAFRIAATETSRAMHLGDFVAAQESDVVTGKFWIASSDACPRCLAAARLGVIPLNRPYFVDPKGGPYAVVLHPPRHPHCLCSQGLETEYSPSRRGRSTDRWTVTAERA